jgi:uncharacterized lipoprotein YddW (UPF0748 family)
MLRLTLQRLTLVALLGASSWISFATRTPAQLSQDPAEQTAPAGLVVRPGSEPINPLMARMMRDELNNLVGRFESALLLGSSFELPAQLNAQLAGPTVVASVRSVGVSTPQFTHPVLTDAEQLLSTWDTLISQGQYAEARSKWLQVRQQLWREFPIDRPIAQPEVRAIWLDRGTIVRAGSREGLEALFDRMAAAGINTVFVETVNAGYPIYPSRVAPQQNPLTRHWDPLAAAVDLGKARGMQIHAWIWTFAAGNQVHNRLLNLPTQYLGPVLNAHPDWAGYDTRGNIVPVGQGKPFLDPANPEVRSYLMRLLQEIVTQYDVDGIQLDYIRYPFQDPSANRTYGYGFAARRQFQRLTGVDPITLSPTVNPQLPLADQQRQRYLWEQWTNFRIQQVSSFVTEVSTQLKRQDPDLLISVAVFAKSRQERLQKIQQDWETWAQQGTVDWVVLMSYAEDTNRFEELINPWVVENNYGSTLIIPGIRLLNLSQMAAFDQIQTLRDMPSTGYALFAADNLEAGIQTILRATQGPEAMLRSQPLPQADPFSAAAERYAALQREWSWLLANQQVRMEERRLRQWTTEVNTLGEDLNDLAETPSRRKLAQVRARIEHLRTTIDSNLTVQTASSAYRYRAWNNRLTTIEHLLTYGEARSL